MTMLNTISPRGPTSYFSFEYAQPFQPLGQPASAPAGSSSAWNNSNAYAPEAPRQPIPAPSVQYVVGSPQTGHHRSQSFPVPFGPVHLNDEARYKFPHKRPHARRSTHPRRKQSSIGLHHANQDAAISFPEPHCYPFVNNFGTPPPPYAGYPGPTYGISADQISMEPEHCTFLLTAVNEMDLCSKIFSTWLEQLDRAELGKKDKVEVNVISMITALADDAVKMLTASHNILSSYRALARLMDRRLSTLAASSQGGDLFGPSPSRGQSHYPRNGNDDFQALALDVRVHSTEISACVEKMQDGLNGLHNAVLLTHEKYSFRKRFWGWMCRVFRFIAQGLFIGGVATALHPIGVVGSAAMHVGSGLSTVVASVCEKIKDAYDDEEKGLSEVMKLLQGKIPMSMRVAQTALRNFHAAHTVFRYHQEVAQRRASGYIAPMEAARARGAWHKAKNLLEVKDGTMLQLYVDSLTWQC